MILAASPPAAERLIDEGRGPALLFLHHFGGSGRSWRGVIDRLSHRYHCIAPDLPGFGTCADWPGPFSTSASADEVIALIRRLALEDFSIVGHSMGGKIAMAVAARRIRGLRGLVLLAPSPPTPEPIPDGDRAHLLASWGDRDAMAAIVDKILVRTLSRCDREWQVADMLAASKPAWQGWLNCGSREDISAWLDEITVPMTIVSGDGDQTISAAVLRRELVQRVPTARMEMILGAGHLLPVEARDEVAAIIQHSQREPAMAGGNPSWRGERPHLGI
jgi:pimeloyl-ACP methyl ester carboxylesterase